MRIREQLRRSIDELDDRFREALNAAYMQGARDAVERQRDTGGRLLVRV